MKYKNIKFRNILQLKMTLVLSGVFILTVVVLSSMLYITSYNIITNSTGKNAFRIAKIASEQLIVEDLDNLKTVEDENTPSHERAKNTLYYIRELTGAKYIYAMRKAENGDFMYLAESSEGGETSHIGDLEPTSDDYEMTWAGEPYTGNKIEKYGENEILISSYYPVQDDSGKVIALVGVDYDSREAYEDLQHLTRLSIMIPLISLIIMVLIIMFIARSITGPVSRIAAASSQVAGKNLHIEPVKVKRRDEIGLLAHSFNQMTDTIRSMTSNIKSASSGLEAASAVINMSIEEVSTASSEISENTQQLSAQASLQSLESSSTYEMTDMLSYKIDSVTDKLNLTLEKSKLMKEKNIQGSRANEELSDKFERYQISADTVGAKIDELTRKSQLIESILKSIDHIARQTNILSVNASIEASRAGEHGRGFAVVATQVKSLAMESSESTNKIQEIVDSLILNMTEVEKELSASRKLIDDVKRSLDISSDSYSEISSSVDSTIENIQVIHSDITEIDALKERVVSSVRAINSSITGMADSVNRIGSSTEEQCVSMKEISDSIRNLEDMVGSLASLVNEYSL